MNPKNKEKKQSKTVENTPKARVLHTIGGAGRHFGSDSALKAASLILSLILISKARSFLHLR